MSNVAGSAYTLEHDREVFEEQHGIDPAPPGVVVCPCGRTSFTVGMVYKCVIVKCLGCDREFKVVEYE